jgi:putative oxidoreductase
MQMSKRSRVAYWVLAGIPAAAYLAASIAKLSGSSRMVQNFTHFGYPVWFMYFIGAAELAGALGLLFGGLAHRILPRLAALGLMVIMLGAMASHAMHDPILRVLSPLILFAMLAGFLYVGRSDKQASADRAIGAAD